MSKSWPKDVIRELLALAKTEGYSKATLSTPDEAKLFRFAIYNFRRNEDFGREINVTLDDTAVVLSQREYPIVSIDKTFIKGNI